MFSYVNSNLCSHFTYHILFWDNMKKTLFRNEK